METINIAVYMRVSTKQQADSGLGLEAQERNINSWIQLRYPSTVYKVTVDYYVDAGVSGKTSHRKALNQMITKIKNNQYHLCVIYKVDRLARDVEISSKLKKTIQYSKCKLCSVSEDYDFDSIEGNFSFNMQSVFGEHERQLIAKRTEDSQISKLKRGEFPFRVCYGYIRRLDGKVDIVEEEARIVQFIFNAFEKDTNYTALREAVFLAFNKKFYRDFFERLLKKQQYIGNYEKKGILYKNVVPAIIEEEQFNRVQQLIEHKLKRQQLDCYLFSDLVYCGYCENACTRNSVKKKAKRYYYYRCDQCNEYMNVLKIEEKLRVDILYYLYRQNKTARNQECETKINYLENRKKSMIREYALGMIELPYYKEIIDELEKAIIRHKNQLIVEQNSIAYHSLTLEQKNEFFKQYLSKIVIHFRDGTIHVEYKENK